MSLFAPHVGEDPSDYDARTTDEMTRLVRLGRWGDMISLRDEVDEFKRVAREAADVEVQASMAALQAQLDRSFEETYGHSIHEPGLDNPWQDQNSEFATGFLDDLLFPDVEQETEAVNEYALDAIFDAGISHNDLASYAYPIRPEHFARYKTESPSSDVMRTWSEVERCSIYVHVPFCKSKCRFCPFVVIGHPTEDMMGAYVDSLLAEIELYRPAFDGDAKEIVGFDIGGGTPTILSIDQLRRVQDGIKSMCGSDLDFNSSIETTPKIASSDLAKLKFLQQNGSTRISMGVQSINPRILAKVRQDGNTPGVVERAVSNVREAGFEYMNLDLMYGFEGQSVEDWLATLEFTMRMSPETVTLYRVIYKGTEIEDDQSSTTLGGVNGLYEFAYKYLAERGYKALYGHNMFCKDGAESGLSSYLEERGRRATPYLGLGPGAQSMFIDGMSYNCGQADDGLEKYHQMIASGEFPLQDFYKLPIAEMLSKAIAISFYSGLIDLRALGQRFGVDLNIYFENEIKFLIGNDLMVLQDGDVLVLTKKGAQNMNGIIPLFYSTNSKQYLVGLN